MILHMDSERDIEALIKSLREQIMARCAEHTPENIVTIGVGVDEFIVNDSIQKCLQRADDKLYIDKDRIKSVDGSLRV